MPRVLPRGIRTIGPGGKGLRRTTQGYDFSPSWSPSSRRIVFTQGISPLHREPPRWAGHARRPGLNKRRPIGPIVDASSANDAVSAGEGNDRVYGGRGRDVLAGGAGSDRGWSAAREGIS